MVLFAHGNAELIEYWPDMLDGLRQMGISLFLPEYRGYGRSAGSPSQAAITEDFIEFYDQLVKRPDVDSKRIIFIGRSIGGGAVCSLIPHRQPAALILMSTFTSVTSMARRFMLPGFLVKDPFDNLSVVATLKIPLLIIHGRQENLIPYEHGQQLHKSAPGSKFITYQADHNSCPPDWNAFFKDARLFLEQAGILKKERDMPKKRKSKRDVEKDYPVRQFITKLRRLADCLEEKQRVRIQVAGERVSIPAGAIINIEHERGKTSEEIEFQLKWKLS